MMKQPNKKITTLAGLILICAIAGCADQKVKSLPAGMSAIPNQKDTRADIVSTLNQDVVWAVNLGGERYIAADGISYQTDTLGFGAKTGEIKSIRGAQDPTVYKTYRQGELKIGKRLPNGVYDVSLMFAEPDDIAVGSRVFNVLAENQIVMHDMDVRLARDGNHHSALDRSVVDVEVSDGYLDLALSTVVGEPILSAFVVRRKFADPDAWKLIWNDEFEVDGPPNPDKWNHDIWPAKKVNREDQAYTARLENVRVEDGNLVIEAHKEKYNSADYSSGRIHSLGKGDFLYGRAEIRAKLAAGQGTWSAIWMLPSDPFKYATTCGQGTDWQGSEDCNAWPNSGEIDIMEHVGYDMNRVHGTVHTKDYYWVKGNQRKASVEAKNVSEAFHNYAIEWTPDRIDIFFDGTRYFTYLREPDRWQSWPFDHPYHIILNLAVGGDWGRAGGPIDDSVFPAQMQVDYVRVYAPISSLVSR